MIRRKQANGITAPILFQGGGEIFSQPLPAWNLHGRKDETSFRGFEQNVGAIPTEYNHVTGLALGLFPNFHDSRLNSVLAIRSGIFEHLMPLQGLNELFEIAFCDFLTHLKSAADLINDR